MTRSGFPKFTALDFWHFVSECGIAQTETW
jgi:hypothetical protein